MRLYIYIYSVYNCVSYTLTHARHIIWYLNSTTTCFSLLIFAFFFFTLFYKSSILLLRSAYCSGDYTPSVRSIHSHNVALLLLYFISFFAFFILVFVFSYVSFFSYFPRTSALNTLFSFPFAQKKVQPNRYFVYVYTYRNRPRKNYNAPLCLWSDKSVVVIRLRRLTFTLILTQLRVNKWSKDDYRIIFTALRFTYL